MRRYNEACNFGSDKAFSLKLTNKYLHKIVSVCRDMRDKFNQSSQFAVRIISKVVEANKRDKNINTVFRPLGAIQYDQRNRKVRIDEVSLMT